MTTFIARWMSVIGVVGATSVLSFPAAGSGALQIETVIRAALEHGQKIPQADIKLRLAEARLRQAQGAFDWRITARAGWTRLYFPRARVVGGVRVLTDELESSSSVQVSGGVSRLFRNGLQIQPGITYFPYTSASRAQSFGLTRLQPTVNLQVPLLHAFDSDNPAAAAERAALYDVAGSKFEREAVIQQAVIDAVQTYWRCLAAHQEAAVLGASQSASQAYLASLRKLMSAGQIEAMVVDRAIAKQTQRDADLLKVREAESLCRADLGVLLGGKPDMALPAIATALPNLDRLAFEANALTEQALTDLAVKNRPDVRAFEQYVAAAEERVTGARTGLDPKIDLLLNPDGAFVTVSKSLEANTEAGLLEEAEANASAARVNLTELRDQIRRDITRGVAALRDSLNALVVLRRSAEALQTAVKDARRAAQIGGMEADELRVMEAEYADIEVQLSEGELDCALDLASIRLVTGTVQADGAGAPVLDAALFRSLQFQ